MDHEHSFTQDATEIQWDEKRDEIIVSRKCTGQVKAGVKVPPPTSSPPFKTEPCRTQKEEAYKVRSVVDDHNHHDKPENHSITVMDGASPTKHSVHKDDLDEIPEWINEVVEFARTKADDVQAKYFMCYLGGSEISMTLATGETEYTVILEKVDEHVVN